jgi:hypothetical protein
MQRFDLKNSVGILFHPVTGFSGFNDSAEKCSALTIAQSNFWRLKQHG